MTTPDPKTLPTKGAGTYLHSESTSSTFDPDSPVFKDSDWDAYAKVSEIQPGEITAEAESEDYLDNDDADWNDYQSGSKDAGETGVTLVWLPGEPVHQKLITDFNDGTKRWWLIKYPNGASDVFYGFISSLGKQISRKEKIMRTVKIRNCGKPLLDTTIAPSS